MRVCVLCLYLCVLCLYLCVLCLYLCVLCLYLCVLCLYLCVSRKISIEFVLMLLSQSFGPRKNAQTQLRTLRQIRTLRHNF
jgi:hypothetical protein